MNTLEANSIISDDSMYWKILKRQMPLVSKEEQEKFKNATITVIGCGGIGGLAIEMLARMGVGNLILVDEDEFDISNLNRQTLSSVENIGRKKSEVACEQMEKINPHVNVTSYCEHVDEKNIEKLIENSNVVIDALDNVLTRVILSRKARELKIPLIHGAVYGTQGQLTVFLSNTPSYEEMFNLPSLGNELNEDTIRELEKIAANAPPVIGPTPNLISCLEAIEAYKIVTGVGKVNVSPKILTFDLLDFSSFTTQEL